MNDVIRSTSYTKEQMRQIFPDLGLPERGETLLREAGNSILRISRDTFKYSHKKQMWKVETLK